MPICYPVRNNDGTTNTSYVVGYDPEQSPRMFYWKVDGKLKWQNHNLKRVIEVARQDRHDQEMADNDPFIKRLFGG